MTDRLLAVRINHCIKLLYKDLVRVKNMVTGYPHHHIFVNLNDTHRHFVISKYTRLVFVFDMLEKKEIDKK